MQVCGSLDDVSDCTISVGSLVFHNQHVEGFALLPRVGAMTRRQLAHLFREVEQNWTGSLATDVRMIVALDQVRDNLLSFKDALESADLVVSPQYPLGRVGGPPLCEPNATRFAPATTACAVVVPPSDAAVLPEVTVHGAPPLQPSPPPANAPGPSQSQNELESNSAAQAPEVVRAGIGATGTATASVGRQSPSIPGDSSFDVLPPESAGLGPGRSR